MLQAASSPSLQSYTNFTSDILIHDLSSIHTEMAGMDQMAADAGITPLSGQSSPSTESAGESDQPVKVVKDLKKREVGASHS